MALSMETLSREINNTQSVEENLAIISKYS